MRSNVDETRIDRESIGRLARALSFIKSANDPIAIALRQAVEYGAERDTKRARALFLKLKPAERRAALAAIAG